jgi:hypothetical protein
LEVSEIVNQVDNENIYRHILKLEGTRHPIDTPRALEEAAQYILSEFKQCGLTTEEQTFSVADFSGSFKNIEASVKDGNDSELLVVAHYDTVENCPGADDNASAVAVMLETARVLAKEGSCNVRFVGFSLEELNPAFTLKIREITRNLGLIDKHNHYTNFRTHAVMKNLHDLHRKNWAAGKSQSEAFAAAREQMQRQMNEAELEYVHEMELLFKGMPTNAWLGNTGDVGSAFWVEQAIRAGRRISGVLCFDTIGYTSDKQHSQRFPQGINPQMFQAKNVADPTVGNFLGAIGDVNSGRLAQSFNSQTGLDYIGLPCACLQVPLSYEQMEIGMRDLLRSDHAPFWKHGIPALFLTDTADFRYPYYHTAADTIDRLDFEFLSRICKATIATVIDLT